MSAPAATRQSGSQPAQADTTLKTVAAIVTEYRPWSHADVIVTKLLQGYDLDGVYRRPRVRVASLYTDQVPASDISRGLAAYYNVPIFQRIAPALTLGGDTLAVDGVLLIGEHGDYPNNEKGQRMYPRRRFFEETVEVFRKSGRVVPVFSDKHLSYNWDDALWMYRTAREMGIPFMAGSSLPVTWRRPPLELPLGCEIEEAFCVFHGPIESYGFHALETIQCMVERRRSGETGIAAVQCLEGAAVWEAAAAGHWSRELLEATLALTEPRPEGKPEEAVSQPALFLLEYRDGTRAAALLLNGYVREFVFAARLKGEPQPVATRFYLHGGQPFPHFSHLVYRIEEMILTRRPSYPVERTLLTTGALAALMDSRFEGHRRLETPHLPVVYRVEA